MGLLACAITSLAVIASCAGTEIGPTTDNEIDFHFGVDLSYINEVEDFGATYQRDGEPVDPFVLFGETGHTTVRARLWHSPDWTTYSTVEDVIRTFRRASDAGMQLLLDFHYSDEWADPSKQKIPAAWEGMTDDQMADALYRYTHDTLMELHRKGVLPQLVQIGNETNSGMLRDRGETDWARQALFFNAGIRGIRDVEKRTRSRVKVVLHVAQPENALWFFENAIAAGITDFDVVGLSYYSEWSDFSIPELGSFVGRLRDELDREVMIVETGYAWTRASVTESAGNILTQFLRGYPVTPDGQAAFVADVVQAVMDNDGSGVFYWEPAWVSSKATTLWGQGSHWENATYFDFENGNEVLPAIDTPSRSYSRPPARVDGVVEAAYGEPIVRDAIDDNLRGQDELDLSALYGILYQDYLSAAIVVDEPAGESVSGFYTLLIDCADGGATRLDESRPISIVGPNLPDVRLDFSIEEYKGQSYGRLDYQVWDGGEWRTDRGLCSFSHRVSDDRTVIEFLVNRSLLPPGESISITALTIGRGRANGSADTFETSEAPESWTSETEVGRFYAL